MSATQNLGLPYLEAGQAQKHVTHNEALRALDTLVQLAVQNRDLAAPPVSPGEGKRWIVKAAASGAWTGREDQIAGWQDGAWTFHQPSPGWLAYVVAEAALVVWNGTAWGTFDSAGAPTELQNMSLLGIGTVADAVNPVSARLNNVLWAAQTVAEGGDGTLRYKLNKESADKTLSFLFQDDFSGCAEIGLTGDDDFHFKVSPDGEAWLEAIRIERATGKISFPVTGGPREVLTANRIYYVRADGSNANNGLANTADSAFATLQKAWDTLVTVDLNGFTVTIQLADGVYTGGLNAIVPPIGGNVVVNGNAATPANVVISATGSHAINVGTLAQVTVHHCKVQTTASGAALHALGAGAQIIIGPGMMFGACVDAHIYAQSGGYIRAGNSYTVSGGAQRHYFSQLGGLIEGFLSIVTLSGSPAFPTGFAVASALANISMFSLTFSGSAGAATPRYNATLNSVINTFGGGANFFPGTSVGSAASGGQYA